MLYATSSPVGATGYWPDALAPLKVPFNMNAHYHLVQNRPLWADLFIPKGTQGGNYKGTITVTQHDETVAKIGVEVYVYKFSLTDETPLITYMNVSRGQLAGFYHKPGDSEDIENLTQVYYEKLYANRMEPWFNDMLTPDVPFLITRTPVPPKSNPEWGTFRGYVDNYSVHGNQMNDPELMRVIQEEKANGGELTWYISCDQRYPQPNYFIDAPAMDLVMVPWITARYDMDGILYWAINWWSQTSNPWLDANTFHSGFLCSGGWVLNGEGSLWYPGDFTERYTGQPNVEGPVSSLRFELLREGIEDYVYLSMLKNLGDEEFGSELVRNMVVDVKAFTRNVEVLYNTRKSMAERLEELSR